MKIFLIILAVICLAGIGSELHQILEVLKEIQEEYCYLPKS